MKEADYWQMTLAEATREFEAKLWMIEDNRKASARIAYGQAMTAGSCIASIFGSSKAAEIWEVYPEYFPRAEAMEQQQKIDKSVENFIKFANAHNKKSED